MQPLVHVIPSPPGGDTPLPEGYLWATQAHPASDPEYAFQPYRQPLPVMEPFKELPL